MLLWEILEETLLQKTSRMKVMNGWLYSRVDIQGAHSHVASAMCFVPDFEFPPEPETNSRLDDKIVT